MAAELDQARQALSNTQNAHNAEVSKLQSEIAQLHHEMDEVRQKNIQLEVETHIG